MPRSSTYQDEIVDIPKNISVNQKGYVYYNLSFPGVFITTPSANTRD